MPAARRIKRRKPHEKRKTVYLRVRLTERHAEEVRAEADAVGVSVSAWVTMALRDAVERARAARLRRQRAVQVEGEAAVAARAGEGEE